MVVVLFAACTAFSNTGAWINVSGGYWADTNNWQSGYVPNTTTDLADFSALGAGETVMISNTTDIGAIIFDGTVGDEWIIRYDNQHRLY